MKQYTEITKTMDVLREVHDVLSENILSWKTFCSENGDLDYFRTPDSYHSSKSEQHTKKCLFAVKAKFEGLEKCQRRVIALQTSCQQSARDVSFDQNNSLGL